MEIAGIYERTGKIFTRIDGSASAGLPAGLPDDHYIYKVCTNAADVSTGSEELAAHIHNRLTQYHLSAQRANLLLPFFSFFQHKTILEVGSGCGAITRLLGESNADVTALEIHPLHAAITAERCRDLPAVSVVCDHFNRFESIKQFDVIILAGMLEYPHLNGTGDAANLIHKAVGLLKDDGVIIVAADNALGLKYRAGSPEDQPEKAYYGMNTKDKQEPVTYGKQTLARLLSRAGLEHQSVLFPFPDYRLPSVIYSELCLDITAFNLLNLLLPAVDYVNDPAKGSACRDVREMVDNKLAGELANSFLVVAGKKSHAAVDNRTLAYSYSTGRRKEFSKENIFQLLENDTIAVLRNKLYPAFKPDSSLNITHRVFNETYMPGELYSLHFFDIISTPGWSVNDLVKWLNPYYDLLYNHSQNINGILCLEGKYADLTPYNLLVTGKNNFIIFDQEWEVHEPIPLSYVLARGLFYCLAKPRIFYPAAEGTPAYAFALIKEVLQNFLSTDGIITDFINREKEYFRPVGLNGHVLAKDFQLRFLAAIPQAGAFTLNNNGLFPLSAITVKVFVQTEKNDFSESVSFSRSLELDPQRKPYAIGITNTTGAIKKIRIDPAEQAGLFFVHAVAVKDDAGNELFFWDSVTGEEVECNDMLLLPQKESGKCALLALSDDPAMYFTMPAAFNTSASRHFDVLLDLSACTTDEAGQLARQCNSLLSLITFSGNNESLQQAAFTGPEKHVRELLVWITGRSGRLLQEQLRKAVMEIKERDGFISHLEKKIQEQETTIGRLRNIEQAHQRTMAENDVLMKHLAWYRRTFETRSLAGVMKDRFQQVLQPAYKKSLNALLALNVVQKKYALTYMIEYARDNGMYRSVQALMDVFREEGFKTITKSSEVARGRLRKSFAIKNLPAPVYKKNAFIKDELEEQIRRLAFLPKISVIMPVYNTNPVLLALAIQSVQNQVYHNWELCIIDDRSTNVQTTQALEAFAADARISIRYLQHNAGISSASNAAIEMAHGEYVALLDHDDAITPDALFWIAKEINLHKTVDVLYTDECKIDENGRLSDFFLKPDWSPELLFNMMYTGHFTVYRKAFLTENTGLFRKQYDFSQDYDLMLRAAEKTNNIRHIKKVLYHWRLTEASASLGGKPYARASNIAALQDAVQRRGLNADVIELPHANRVSVRIDPMVMVSIIIPTDSFTQLQAAIESIVHQTTYPDYEIVVVTNSGLIQDMQRFTWANVVYAPYDLPYNFSDKCNCGAALAKGECLIFFNDDVRPLQPDWIEHTIEMLFLPGIGGVSPKLLYENDTIQYAGMATGVRNLTGTTFHGYQKDAAAYFGFPQLVRDVSILSGACLAIKKSLFADIGGFDAVNTPSAHSDVDLSFKILERQLRCVYTPYATLRHIGHLSLKEHDKKGNAAKDKSDIYLLRRWMKYLSEDKYFPRPMVSLLYHDSPEPYTIFPPAQEALFGNRGDVLLVSHDLSLTGAPIMLYNICRVLVTNGYFAIVCCSADGPLRSMYQRLGVPVIIDELVLRQHHSFASFAKNFDYLICNTVVTWPVVKQMQQTVTTVWWLQEAKVIDAFSGDIDFVRTLHQTRNIIAVSDYAISYLSKYNSHYKKIYNACYDNHDAVKNVERINERFIISIIGSIEYRKGQDILFDAFDHIPEALLSDIEVWVIGRIHDPAFKAAMDRTATGKPFVHFKGEVSNEMSVAYIHQSDVIISASRDDPFPVVLVEAFSLAKTCIVSENTGLVELIEEGKNGFTFYNEDAIGLANKISFVLNNRNLLEQIGRNARKTYEKYLTIEQLEQQLLQYLKSISDGDANTKPSVVKTAETS